MPEITWDALDQRFFETGVDHGVLYKPVAGLYTTGVAWNGLTGVTESPSGGEPNAQYADNIKYLNLISAEEFNATIEAFTYPDEFLAHDGIAKTVNGMQIGQQGRPIFGFSWRSKKGNALDEDLGYILHLAYGCQAAPSEKARTTVNDTPEAMSFSWSLSTTPVPVTGYRPTAIIHVDSTDPDVTAAGLAALEDVLYGRNAEEPRLPLPDEVNTLLGTGAVVESTSATAGSPGTWSPGGSTPPEDAAEANADGVTASPTSAWTTGQYVQGNLAGAPGEMYWNGTTWVSGRAA